MKKHIMVFFLAMATVVGFVPVTLATDVSGTISTNTVWQASGSPYVVTGDMTVAEGATLTVEPGVVVQFNQYMRLYVDGTLTAEGTQESPITFTGTTESSSWWGGITIQNNGSATFDWCDVGYGGYSVSIYGYEKTGILKIGSGSLTLKNSTIHHPGGNELRIESGSSEFISSGNTFSNNNYGVWLRTNASFEDTTSVFGAFNENVFTRPSYNATIVGTSTD